MTTCSASSSRLARVVEERQLADLRFEGWEWSAIAGRLGGSAHPRRMQLARAVHRVAKDQARRGRPLRELAPPIHTNSAAADAVRRLLADRRRVGGADVGAVLDGDDSLDSRGGASTSS